ncbi:MAG: metalloregulator ArsR/SmtB family transcription factor [Candidatus Lokiarchaeota archaeon]|nr:metalloregulator ArsR/SmtB family transcription factor [Candidatus Lokiarchaeota archaeon]
MSEDRFQKYIEDIEPTLTCERFLDKYKKEVEAIKKRKNYDKHLNYFKALSSELRVLIFNLLQKHPMCTCALSKIFNKSEATISHHLKKLEDAKLVIGKKEGYYTLYYTKHSFTKELKNMIIHSVNV